MKQKLFYGYEKKRKIGKGQDTEIFEVKIPGRPYKRALKVSNKKVRDKGDPIYQSFIKEYNVLSSVDRSYNKVNIVNTYRCDLIDEHAIIEMDYIDGNTLDNYIKEQKKFIDYSEVEIFIQDIVGALAYVHYDIYKSLMDPEKDNLELDPNDGRSYSITEGKERELVDKYGILHNDLHSNNVMRNRNKEGHFFLIDFGLAIQRGECVKSGYERGGCPEYRAPEKFEERQPITAQSDIYSLGILLYEILAGRPPFVLEVGSDGIMTRHALDKIQEEHQTAPPPPIFDLRKAAFETVRKGEVYKRDYPEWLDKVIMKCLSKKPEDRYANARELLDDINQNIAFEEQKNKPTAEDSISIKTTPQKVEKNIEEDNIQRKSKSEHIRPGKTNNKLIYTICVLIVLVTLGVLWYFNKGDSSYIPVEEIIVPTQEYRLTIGDTIFINSKVRPANATDTIVRWKSSNSEVVNVDGNIFKAQKEGQAILTAVSEGGKVTTKVSVIVSPDISKLQPSDDRTIMEVATMSLAEGNKLESINDDSEVPIIIPNDEKSVPPTIIIPNNIQDALNMLIDSEIPKETRLNSIPQVINSFFEVDAKIRTVGDTDITLDYENVADFLRRIILSRRIVRIEIIGSEKREKLTELSIKEIDK